MKKREVDLLQQVLATEESSGCDDLKLENTDENWEIVESALAWNVHKTVEQYRKDKDDTEYKERPKLSNDIYTSFHLVKMYLIRKALCELVQNATD